MSTVAKTPTVANTPSKYYIDTAAVRKACEDDFKEIDKACAAEDKKAKEERLKNANKDKKHKLGALLNKLKLPDYPGTSKNPAAQWINDHCDFLKIKPSDPTEIINNLKKIPDQIQGQLTDALKNAGTPLVDKAVEAGKGLATRTVAKEVAGGTAALVAVEFPPAAAAIEIGTQALVVADTASTIFEVGKQAWSVGKEALPKIKDLWDQGNKVQELLTEYEDNPKKLASDVMYAAADLNSCTRKRRCRLVPYRETHGGNKKSNKIDNEEEDFDSIQGPASGKGCCPGQTGHHVLPGAMFKDCAGYKKNVKIPGAGSGPAHQMAPTLCVEGVNNSHGSHGHVHKTLGTVLEKKFPGVPNGTPIDKGKAIDAGAESVKEAFPESGCNKECLKAQLHAFYDDLECEPKKAAGLPGGGKDAGSTAIP